VKYADKKSLPSNYTINIKVFEQMYRIEKMVTLKTSQTVINANSNKLL